MVAPPSGRSQRFLARFSRRTTAGRTFIPEIDGLRAVAIAMVLLAHANGHLATAFLAKFPAELGSLLHSARSSATALVFKTLETAGFGVELFFVISGFILALPFIAWHRADGEPVRVGRFYLRRITRLEPPYLIALTIAFVASVIFGARGLAPHYVAGLGYLHGPVFRTFNPVNPVTWSLEIEFQFYLVMPLLATVFLLPSALLRRALMVVAALVCIGLRVMVLRGEGDWLVHLVPGYLHTVLAHLQFFAVGLLLADIYLIGWKRNPPRSARWDLIALVAWVLLFAVLNRFLYITKDTATGTAVWAYLKPFAIGAAFYASLRSPRISAILRSPWVYTLGGMCYSIYLVHYPLIDLWFPRWVPVVSSHYLVTLLVGLVICLPIVLALSGVFFIAIERPCMDPDWTRRVRDRFKGRRSPVLGSEAPPS